MKRNDNDEKEKGERCSLNKLTDVKSYRDRRHQRKSYDLVILHLGRLGAGRTLATRGR